VTWEKIMRKMFVVMAVALLGFIPATSAAAEETATPEEVVEKVRAAAAQLSRTHDVSEFNQKQSPWVWKDTYVFVQDCDKQKVAAHPISPDRVGKDLASVKDAKGHRLYPDVQRLCSEARQPSGIWIEYRWPKPGQKEESRKVTYFEGAKGTPYIVGAGIYDDKQTAAELQKITRKELNQKK
jgi:cytochrome c